MVIIIAISLPFITSIGNYFRASYSSSFINTTKVAFTKAIMSKPIKIKIITFIIAFIITSFTTLILNIIIEFIAKSIIIIFIKHFIMITMSMHSINFKAINSIKLINFIIILITFIIILIFITLVITLAIITTYSISFNNLDFLINHSNYSHFNYYFAPYSLLIFNSFLYYLYFYFNIPPIINSFVTSFIVIITIIIVTFTYFGNSTIATNLYYFNLSTINLNSFQSPPNYLNNFSCYYYYNSKINHFLNLYYLNS